MLNQKTLTSAQPLQARFPNGVAYALGMLDMNEVTRLTGCLENGLEYIVLIPFAVFPENVRRDPDFLHGCEFGYLNYEEESVSILSVANWVVRALCENLREPGMGNFDGWLWTTGFVLGWLSHVAEKDVMVAQVGLAHLCFALTHIHPSSTENRALLLRGLHQCDIHHTLAMKAYRARVRDLVNGGLDLPSAYVRALILYTRGNAHPQSHKNNHKGVIIPFRPRCS